MKEFLLRVIDFGHGILKGKKEKQNCREFVLFLSTRGNADVCGSSNLDPRYIGPDV